MAVGIESLHNVPSPEPSMKDLLAREAWGLAKYGLVGGSSLALHVGLYHLQSRILWPHASWTVEYIFALVIASIYNFTLHRMWTFGVQGSRLPMIGRYGGIVLCSMALQSIVFHVGVDLLRFYDYAVFAVSAACAALFQYFGHRFFTFHHRFEKKEL